MGPAADFEDRVAAIIERFDADVRDAVRDDLRPLLERGVRCEADLFAIVEDNAAEPVTRERAFWLLARLGTRGTAPALFKALEDPDAGLRSAAARLIGESSLAEAVDLLAERLSADSVPAVRRDAAYALGQLAVPDALAPLVGALHDASSMVRGMAVEALAYVRDVSAMPSILQALRDPSAEVRYWGAFAAGEIGGEDAIPALQRLVQSDDAIAASYGAVRVEAEEAIRRIEERGQRH